MSAATLQGVVTAPAASDLLTAWELGLPCSTAQRSVVLLGALLSQRPAEDLLAISLGERDEHLLHAHRVLFGPRLDCVVTCPSCSAELELDVAVDDLLGAAEPGDVVGAADIEVRADGWLVHARPIELRDVLDAAAAPDPKSARETLLARCVVSATAVSETEPAPAAARELPRTVENALLAELERGNPTGALDFEQTCPECQHVWTTPFDAVSFLWAELDGWAQRTLREVHRLATAYGWRESDILTMSPARRATYLEMSGHG